MIIGHMRAFFDLGKIFAELDYLRLLLLHSITNLLPSHRLLLHKLDFFGLISVPNRSQMTIKEAFNPFQLHALHMLLVFA